MNKLTSNLTLMIFDTIPFYLLILAFPDMTLSIYCTFTHSSLISKNINFHFNQSKIHPIQHPHHPYQIVYSLNHSTNSTTSHSHYSTIHSISLNSPPSSKTSPSIYLHFIFYHSLKSLQFLLSSSLSFYHS